MTIRLAKNKIRSMLVALLCCAALLFAGCATTGKNETTGTVLGGVLGGVAGAFFGKGSGKVAAVLVGAGLGALIGNRIGADLDEDEQKALALATQDAAENAKTNERISWAAPEKAEPAVVEAAASEPAPTAAKAEMKPAPTKTKAALVQAKPKANKSAPASQTTVAEKTEPKTAKPAAATGWVIPTSDPYKKDGTTCRDLKQIAVKDGQEITDDITMCRQVADTGQTEWVIPE